MSGEEKNKLDDIFKSGLDVPDTHFEYNTNDWDNMEHLMDAHTKRRGIVYWLPMLSGVAAALLIFLGWWFFKPASVAPVQVAVVKRVPVQQAPGNANQPAHTAAQLPAAGQQPNNAGSNTTAPLANAKPANGLVNHITVNQIVKAQTYAGLHNHPSKPAGKSARIPVNGGLNGQDIVAISNDPKPTPQTVANANSAAQPNNSTATIAGVTAPAVTPAAVNAQIPDKSQDAAAPAAPDNGKKIKAAVSGSRGPQLGLAIMVSPDINGAGSFQNAQVGTNIGLQFSVGLTKKLTISTGAAYSKKPYLTDFSNYASNYKFKTDPQSVSADCRVLDIPINIDYKVYSRSRNSFSVGTGLSSYIMLNERYTYNYADPATAGPADFVVTNKNRHIFGVMNLNATFEHEVNSKMSIAAQPYLKVPLTEIGYSQVKLQSAGVAVGVRWKLNR